VEPRKFTWSTVDRIRTPLLVAQGANDVRVVQAESDNIVAPLRARGVPVEYLVADDEGHGFENPENQIMLFHAIDSCRRSIRLDDAAPRSQAVALGGSGWSSMCRCRALPIQRANSWGVQPNCSTSAR
jgi:dienelactone hydrolase